MEDTEIIDDGSTQQATANPSTGQPPVDAARKALVGEWQDRIKRAEKFWSNRFKKMRKAQYLATNGADEAWVKAKKYVVPVVVRYINQIVAQLYAKNPKASATRKRRMMYQIWDGDPASYTAAVQKIQQPPIDPHTGQPVLGPDGKPLIDPNAMALVQEVQKVQQYDQMVENMGRTLEILWDYFLKAQEVSFKKQFKAALRRSKVCGVGYVKLAYQRQLEMRPEIAAQIDDVTSQIATLEAGMTQVKAGEIEPDSAKMEELRLLHQQLQNKAYIVVREGPVFDFPRADEIIPDPDTRQLKTFAGARFIAHRFTLTPEKILKIYKVDVGTSYTAYRSNGRDEEGRSAVDQTDFGSNTTASAPKSRARVYEIQDRELNQSMVICEGHDDFLREPAEPDVCLSRFWTVFPLVFNEPESDEQIYPESDVMLLTDTQKAYNANRQGLKEHRMANKPKHFAAAGALEEEDKKKLQSYPTNAIIEIRAIKPGQKVEDLIQAGKNVPIDPQQYEVETIFNDILRTVGSQEANMGGTASNTTATQSSIAEESRDASISDSVDDLDDVLSDLAHAFGELVLLNMEKQTVVEIVGPGAVWPDMQPTREDVCKDLYLDVVAGSSGRRNQAADLAKWERAWPLLSQTPGVTPKALVRNVAPLLDIDMDELYSEGMPSIAAMNAAQGQASPPGQQPQNNPNAQGPQGHQNAPHPMQGHPGPQPAYPAGQPHLPGPNHVAPSPPVGAPLPPPQAKP